MPSMFAANNEMVAAAKTMTTRSVCKIDVGTMPEPIVLTTSPPLKLPRKIATAHMNKAMRLFDNVPDP